MRVENFEKRCKLKCILVQIQNQNCLEISVFIATTTKQVFRLCTINVNIAVLIYLLLVSTYTIALTCTT